jgi:hypothetical protein
LVVAVLVVAQLLVITVLILFLGQLHLLAAVEGDNKEAAKKAAHQAALAVVQVIQLQEVGRRVQEPQIKDTLVDLELNM